MNNIVPKALAYIGKRNTGKTHNLIEQLEFCIQDGYVAIIFDTATQHKNKSILYKAKNMFPDMQIFNHENIDCIETWEDEKRNLSHLTNNVLTGRIIGFDLSHYLELSYEYDDPVMRRDVRNIYKQQVAECLTHISHTALFCQDLVLFFDEIEFIESTCQLLKTFSEKDIGIYCSVHEDSSLGSSIEWFELIRLDYCSKFTNKFINKEEDVLCCSACLDFIFNEIYGIQKIVRKNIVCIADAALILSQGIDIEVFNFNSSLFQAFLRKTDTAHPQAFYEYTQQLADLIASNILVQQRQLTRDNLVFDINSNRCVLLCLSSSVFFGDPSLDGGHFIVATKVYSDFVSIINPGAKAIYFEEAPIKMLMNSLISYGSWRINCK